MAVLAWPLQVNHIRRDVRNNAFGMVRNGGTRAHQGWDLYARPLTPCYAIADGTVFQQNSDSYGWVLVLKFKHLGQVLYAAYCHLSARYVLDGNEVKRGELIGLTGNTGNARTMTGDDQHLHFEIRTTPLPSRGLTDRIDPARLYGRAPIGWTFYEGHGGKIVTSGGDGLHVKGVNVRERIE